MILILTTRSLKFTNPLRNLAAVLAELLYHRLMQSDIVLAPSRRTVMNIQLLR